MKKLFCCLSVMVLVSGCSMFESGSHVQTGGDAALNDNSVLPDPIAECTEDADCSNGKICSADNTCDCPSDKPYFILNHHCVSMVVTQEMAPHMTFDPHFEAVNVTVANTATLGQACSTTTVMCVAGLGCVNGLCIQSVGLGGACNSTTMLCNTGSCINGLCRISGLGYDASCDSYRLCGSGLGCASWVPGGNKCKKLAGYGCAPAAAMCYNFGSCHQNVPFPGVPFKCH